MHFQRIFARRFAGAVIASLFFVFVFSPSAYAQEPTPTPPPVTSTDDGATDKLLVLMRLAFDILQGKTTVGSDQLFEQSKQSVRNLIANSNTDIFFLDFGNPNLRLNQFTEIAAKNLLMLTPLYIVGYAVFLVYSVWKERPVPNPIFYTALVIAVMVFLAAFAVITQGVSEIGRAIVLAFGGAGDALYPRALLDIALRTLITLQEHGGILATPVLLVGAAETIIILIQLAYRGISLAIWRLLAVLAIPFSVLLEGIKPKTAGRVISGFFEAWLDLVGKMALLLIILAIANADAFANQIAFVLPAGLLVVILSWKFFGIFFVLIRGAVARAWLSFAPETLIDSSTPLPAAAEAVRAREIDAARRERLEE